MVGFLMVAAPGANDVTFLAGGTATIRSKDSAVDFATENGYVSATKRTATEWWIAGDLS